MYLAFSFSLLMQVSKEYEVTLIAFDSRPTPRDLCDHPSQPTMGPPFYIGGHCSGNTVKWMVKSNPLADLKLQNNISFSLENWSTLQTLSPNTNPDGTSDIKGLLYVPNLSRTDPCINITAPYIPRNVTRKSDLPNYQDAVPLVTVAPWVSVNCTQSFLAASRRD
ncbi:MAG: hypothetical protein ACJ788_19790 [Ktedonobacteraceae bacterium]